MDEGRLGAVRRQQDVHRKNMIVMNDIINYRQNIYTCYLNKERQNTEAKLKAQEVYLKKSIVRNNFLLQCMEARKLKAAAEKSSADLTLGRYGGRPINAFSKDVDARMAWIHPRLRRLRKVDRMKQKLGAVIDFATMQEKIDAILNRKPGKAATLDTQAEVNVKQSRGQGQNRKLPPLNSRLNETSLSDSVLFADSTQATDHSNYAHLGALHTLSRVTDNNNKKTTNQIHTSLQSSVDVSDSVNLNRHQADNENTKLTKVGNTNDLDNHTTVKVTSQETVPTNRVTVTAVSQIRDPPPLVRRPTLILPPIQSTKEMKIHGFGGI